MLSYTVIGTGAVGGYYGGRLAQANHTVRFLARSDYEYIRHNGLTVQSVKGDFHLSNVEVYKDSTDIPHSDVILISLKTTENVFLKELLRPIVKKGTILCVLQNGLGIESELHQEFPESIIVGAMCFICSQKAGPGIVKHLDFGHITIAAYDSSGLSSVKTLQREFDKAMIQTKIAETLGEARWRKLLWNIPYNGLSVVLNADTAQIMSLPASRGLVRELMEEVVNAASACGHPIGEDSIEAMLNNTDRMTPYAPSMKLDYENGRPMEIEYMYSNPIDAAGSAGYSMIRTEMLANLLLFKDRVKAEPV
ncbi:MAG: putative 2-dehydropantoate 2-reductase [Spirochaetes bacterium]|jgi:2-dehydropantoate 2-reductase|nr:putative 2-dehydropantoate 2-reductase [Spirochaetota bacterium]